MRRTAGLPAALPKPSCWPPPLRTGYPIACFGHAGYKQDPAVQEKVQGALDEWFTQVLARGGAITGKHGIGIAKQRWWPQAVSEVGHSVHESLKLALDPQGLLNPDKFVTIHGAR